LIRDETYSDIEYHQQNNDHYCGPATAMMIMNTLDDDLIVQQDTLYQYLHPDDGEWYTSPDGLANGLDWLAPPAFRNRFVAKLALSEPEGTALIVAALRVVDGPLPAALVYGKGHWVVVTDADVTSGADGSLVVNGLVLNVPSQTPLNPPLPHDDEDFCGSNAGFGVLNKQYYVSYEAWKRELFTGYPSADSTLRYAVVCTDDVDAAGVQIDPSAGRIRSSATFRVETMRDTLPIGPDEACDVLLNAIADRRLHYSAALTEVESAYQAGEPQLVSRLDVPGAHYYLIPLLRANSQVALGRVDAQQGSFMGFSSSAGSEPALHDARGLRYASPQVVPDLVWRPCRESPSPLEPFHRVIGPDGIAFRSQAGRTFSALTPFGAG